ncbi:hypothetical protein U1Q18_016013, partial [Sarracenia purpurea var. burkii]
FTRPALNPCELSAIVGIDYASNRWRIDGHVHKIVCVYADYLNRTGGRSPFAFGG